MTDNEPQRMVHDECGEGRFSWIVEMVQFGDILRYEKEDARDKLVEEGFKNGEVTGLADTPDDLRHFCTTCDEYVERDSLIPESEYDE